jgi:hypothetical protein
VTARRSDYVSSEDLTRLGRHLKDADRRLLKELRDGLKRAVMPAIAEAKSNASWSRRIPGAIKPRVAFPKRGAQIGITVSRKAAPHARPYENTGVGGAFQHYVFGNRRNIVTQAARPFFLPAMVNGKESVTREVDRIAERVARQITQ